MKNYLQTIKTYILTHKKLILLVLGILIVIIGAVLVVWTVRSRQPTYKPVSACDILTVARAEKLLGDHVINHELTKPVITGDIATSQCVYTDYNENDMHVAALVVKSATDDKGITALRSAFKTQKAAKGMTAVKDLADSAYYNAKLGLLYVLNGREVLIVRAGSANNVSVDDQKILVNLAHTLVAKN